MTRAELWAFLEARAVELRDSCAAQWRQAQQNTQRLGHHLERLQGLYLDYGHRHRALQNDAHQVHQTASLRQTLQQLLALQQRVAVELAAAHAHEEQCRQRLQRAETEVLKARTVLDSNRRAMLKAENRAEQRRLDVAAVQRHWTARLAEDGG